MLCSCGTRYFSPSRVMALMMQVGKGKSEWVSLNEVIVSPLDPKMPNSDFAVLSHHPAGH